MTFYGGYVNRTLCNVLEEMRKCYETRNFSPLAGLIEEAQSMGNRMEAGLSDKSDLNEWREERAKLKKEMLKLIKQKKEMEANMKPNKEKSN